MAAADTIDSLKRVRREIRALTRALPPDTKRTFAHAYQQAVSDAATVVTRAIRRAGDGHSPE